MARTLTPAEMESVRETQQREAARAAARIRTALQPPEGSVKLYDPHHDRLTFGQTTIGMNGPLTTDQLIVFGHLEPGVAIVRADHPLLPALRRRHPSIQVFEPGEEPGRTYACEVCDGEYRSKRALANHRKEAHPAPPASARDEARNAARREAPRRPAPTAVDADDLAAELLDEVARAKARAEG